MKDCQILVKTYFVTGMTRRFVSAKRLIRLIMYLNDILAQTKYRVISDTKYFMASIR